MPLANLPSSSGDYIQNQTATIQDADFRINGRVEGGTLILPQAEPVLNANEVGLYSTDSGFSAETILSFLAFEINENMELIMKTESAPNGYNFEIRNGSLYFIIN